MTAALTRVADTLPATFVEQARDLLAQATSVDHAKEIRDQARALELYMRDRGASDESIRLCAKAKLWAERRIGEFTGAMEKASAGRKPAEEEISNTLLPISKREQLEAAGLSKMQASRFEKYARMDEGVFEAEIERRVSRVARASGSDPNNAATNHSRDYEGDEWYTPQWLTDAAHEVMGGIDLDPASCAAAQRVVRAAKFYTREDDALEQPWSGRVWCNPPYSTPLIDRFTERLLEHIASGDVPEAMYLVNNSTDTAWFHSLLFACDPFVFRGRLKFWHPERQGFAARQGQVLFYHGPHALRLREVLAGKGVALTAWE